MFSSSVPSAFERLEERSHAGLRTEIANGDGGHGVAREFLKSLLKTEDGLRFALSRRPIPDTQKDWTTATVNDVPTPPIGGAIADVHNVLAEVVACKQGNATSIGPSLAAIKP